MDTNQSYHNTGAKMLYGHTIEIYGTRDTITYTFDGMFSRNMAHRMIDAIIALQSKRHNIYVITTCRHTTVYIRVKKW